MEDWKGEMEIIKFVFPDAQIISTNAQYEAFHAIVDGIRMIFYPHKSSSNNYHLRVRNGSTSRNEDFLDLAGILQNSKPTDCTFTVKNQNMALWLKFRKDCPVKKYKSYWDNAKILHQN